MLLMNVQRVELHPPPPKVLIRAHMKPPEVIECQCVDVQLSADGVTRLVCIDALTHPITYESVVDPMVMAVIPLQNAKIIDAVSGDGKCWIVQCADGVRADILPPRDEGIWVDWRRDGDLPRAQDVAKHELWWSLVVARAMLREADDHSKRPRKRIWKSIERAFQEVTRAVAQDKDGFCV